MPVSGSLNSSLRKITPPALSLKRSSQDISLVLTAVKVLLVIGPILLKGKGAAKGERKHSRIAAGLRRILAAEGHYGQYPAWGRTGAVCPRPRTNADRVRKESIGRQCHAQ